MTEEQHKQNIIGKYGIQRLPTIDILSLFPNFNETLSAHSFLEGTSPPMDILLVKSLARKFQECSYLEIGTWRGESIANVSEVAKECISVTLSVEEMKLAGYSDELIKVHGTFCQGIKNIKIIHQSSLKFDFNSLQKKFDLIFIDGDHSYKAVLSDTTKIFGLRKNKDSIIAWHDYGFTTEKVRYSVLNAILDGIPRDKHKNLFHVSNTISAIYIEKEYPVYQTQFPMDVKNIFSIKVKMSK